MTEIEKLKLEIDKLRDDVHGQLESAAELLESVVECVVVATSIIQRFHRRLYENTGLDENEAKTVKDEIDELLLKLNPTFRSKIGNS